MPTELNTGYRHRYTRPEHLEQFIARKPSGCWLWTGPRGGNGQAQVTYQGLRQSARNVLWEIVNKSQLDEGAKFRVRCGTSGCVNPAHFTREALSDEEWDAVALEYIRTGCRHQDIAVRLGCSRESATRRIGKALSRLGR